MTSSQHIRTALDAATKALSQANSENHIKFARERARNASKVMHRVAHSTSKEVEQAEAEALRLIDESLTALELAAIAERTTASELRNAREGLLKRVRHRAGKGASAVGSGGGGAGTSTSSSGVGTVSSRSAEGAVAGGVRGDVGPAGDDVDTVMGGEGAERIGGGMEVRSLGYARLNNRGGEAYVTGLARNVPSKSQEPSPIERARDTNNLPKQANQTEQTGGKKAGPPERLWEYGTFEAAGTEGEAQAEAEKRAAGRRRTVGEKDKRASVGFTDLKWRKVKRTDDGDGRLHSKSSGLGHTDATDVEGERDKSARSPAASNQEGISARSERQGEEKREIKKKTGRWSQDFARTKARLQEEMRVDTYKIRREF